MNDTTQRLGTDENPLLARWESKSGKHWVELTSFDTEKWGTLYSYTGPGCGGGWDARTPLAEAVAEIVGRVLRGEFQPDANKTPLALVYTAEGVTVDAEAAKAWAEGARARFLAFLATVPKSAGVAA